jgi:hypothetical protein
MRAFAITAALLAGLSGTSFAQGTSSSGSGAIHGQNWTMGQDLNNARNLAPQPGTLAADRTRRAERQRQLARDYDGVGRPATNVPQPTPQAGR